MTPDRRAELRRIARCHAFDAAFAETPVVVALGRAWTEARSVLAPLAGTPYRRLYERAVGRVNDGVPAEAGG